MDINDRASLPMYRRPSRPKTILSALAACLLLLVLGSGSLATEPTIKSPADLWKGYDPEAEPLEIEVIKKWNDEDIDFEKLTFTGEEVDGKKIRVLAICGTPPADKQTADAKRPGILHIHGGGQTVSLEWIKYWCKRGYVCVSYDYSGPWDNRKEFTDWGPLTHCNMAQAKGGLQVSPSPRTSSWYHWAVVARRALTLLAQQPRVDRERLGIFGVSMGGSMCWSVAASDPRVRTAVPIYGCGYWFDAGRAVWGFEELSPELQLWQQTVSPEAHAPYIHCPVLLLDATNDFHGWLDDASKILNSVPATTRAAWTPNSNHHIRALEADSLPAWMDWQLRNGEKFPSTPTLEIDLDEAGVPRCRVRTDDSQAIERVDVYYALGLQPPPDRFWRLVPAKRDDAIWSASLPIMNIWHPTHVFANVYYKRPICLSSDLKTYIAGQLGIARATLQWSGELSTAGGWRYLRASPDPNNDRIYLLPAEAKDPSELRFNPKVIGDKVSIHSVSNYLADPQFVGPPGADLAFSTHGKLKSGMKLSITSSYRLPQSKTYSVTLSADDLSTAKGEIRLPLDKFLSEDGEPPTAWSSVNALQIDGDAADDVPPVFGNFHWELSSDQSPPPQAGVGISLRVNNGKVFVDKVLPDTPAARSQLVKANDQIIAVAEQDGEPVDVVGTTEVAKVVGMIRGPKHSVVRLTIVPEGLDEKEQLVVSLVRGDIKEIDAFSDGRLLPHGAKAPNFKFTRLGDAGEAELSTFAGRIVVVEFWASWCGPCIKAIDHLKSVQAQHPEWAGHVELLMVGVDEKKEDAVALFNEKQWTNISVVWAGPDVLKMYRVSGLPTIFVINRDGLVAAVDHRLDVSESIKPLLR